MPASDKKQKINHFVVIGLIELIFISAWSYLMFFSPESLRLNNVLEINVDAYVRLEKIYQWLDGGGWFFKILSRVGVEDHLVLHWTRPLDVLIAPLALLLKPFYGLHDAVYIAGPMMSLPVGIIFYAMASRLALICGQRRYDSMQFSAIFVLLVPHFLFVLTHRNWPDHHGLLLLLFLASLLLASRMIEGGKHAIWMLGLVLALGVWVSVEAMFALLSINIGLGLLWVTGLVKNTAKTSLLASLATLGGIAFSLLAEFATLFPGMALDRISTFSLLGAGAISFIWLVAYIGDRRFAHPFVRALIGAISAIVAGTLLFIIRPEVIHGPMADADKWFVEVWGGIYGDGFYLVALGVNFIIAGGIISSVWLGTKDKKSLIAGILFMPAMLIYAGFFNANSERWAVYAEIIAIIFIIPAFFRIYDYLKSKPGIVSSVFPAIGVVVLFSLAGADTVLGQM
ncbi:MAG: hypothetical protein OEL50_04230, partial [Rhodospirillaceae bacterium]|nr:hypothetical protein [Rhodospirillaceae bacterium]